MTGAGSLAETPSGCNQRSIGKRSKVGGGNKQDKRCEEDSEHDGNDRYHCQHLTERMQGKKTCGGLVSEIVEAVKCTGRQQRKQKSMRHVFRAAS